MSGYDVLGDWGTSRLRLYRMVKGIVVGRLAGPGIAALDAPSDHILTATLASWDAAGAADQIILSGMVGSRNGWQEVAYADCPCDVADWRRSAARLMLNTVPVTIAAGLACIDAVGRHDVMRGEETQIFGALHLDKALLQGRHLLALPGTHSKWVTVEDGVIMDFRTFLTGELFALLRNHSILMGAAGDADGGFEDKGFVAGIDRVAQGAPLLGALFETRSAQLRAGRSPGWAQAFLSGLLIGSEIVATIALDPEAEIVLIGDPALLDRYTCALDRLGRRSRAIDGETCVIAGLGLLRK